MHILRAPRVNQHEDDLQVAEVCVVDGARVASGDPICVVESAKSLHDIEAPVTGYVRRLGLRVGQRVRAGDVICVFTATPDTPLPDDPPSAHALATPTPAARAETVTEPDPAAHRRAPRAPQGARLVILGAGGHARALVDLIRVSRPDLRLVAALDDSDDAPPDVLGVPVLGTSARLSALRAQGITQAALGVGSIAHNAARAALFARLSDLGFTLPSLVHARASVEPSATLGHGAQIFAGAIVGANVSVFDNAIVNCGAILSHDCIVGPHAHVTSGAILAGGVSVGASAVVGMGATVYLGVRIGSGARIANGCHIAQDVPDDAIVRRSTL